MSTPKIQKLINFYNDKSIGDSERAVAASKLIPLLIEQGNWTKPVSGSHGEDLAILNMKYLKANIQVYELGSENYVLKRRIELLKTKIENEKIKTKNQRYIMFFLGSLIGIIIAWFSK